MIHFPPSGAWGSAVRSRLHLCFISVLACALPIWGADSPSGTVVRVHPDRTCSARFSSGRVTSGDVYALVRDGESVGEMVIVSVTTAEVSCRPAEGLLGSPKIGDQLIFARVAGPAPKPTDWLLWSDPDAGFAIRAPRSHTRVDKVERRGAFTLQQHVETFTDTTQYVAFRLIWFDIPAGYLESEEVSKPSKETLEELEKRNFRVTGSKTISHLGMQGLEYTVALGEIFGRMRIFITDRRIYQLLIISYRHEVSNRLAQRFFDSLALYASAGRPVKAPPLQTSKDAPQARL